MGLLAMGSERIRFIRQTLLIAALYAVCAEFGFQFAIAPGNVSALWPASGVAFAAVIMLGARSLPGVWLGSFAANFIFFLSFHTLAIPPVVAAGLIAAGSTIQTALGGYLLRRLLGTRSALDSPGDAFKFVFVTVLSCIVAASVGVLTLGWAGLTDLHSFDNIRFLFRTWWAGDISGVLIFTSFALTWRQWPECVTNRRLRLELIIFQLLMIGAAESFAFGGWFPLGREHYPLTYFFFPLLMWAAARFGAPGVTLSAVIIEIIAVVGTKHGYGPFATLPGQLPLVLLQGFMTMVALSGLSAASVLNDWQRSRDQLKEFAQGLEEKIANRTAELEQANRDLTVMRDQAIESVNLKSAFLANMSHELRTPLAGIISASELLGTADSVATEKQLIKILEESARSLLSIVNEILDLAKLEAGKVILENEPFNLIYLVQDSARLMALAANAKGIVLKTSVDHRIPELVRGDHSRVRQTILNLLGNAVKFTDAGEVCLSVSLRDQDSSSVMIHFEVKDTGIGIAEDEQRFLFRPFTQVDNSTMRKYGGTGLGLSICKQLVELMGGHIGMESKKGEGSVFWFALPFSRCIDVSEAADLEVTTAAVAPDAALAGRVVLIVEDNRLIRSLVARQLAGLGIKTNEASNGHEAVASATATRYDLILMDCQMPEMDGFTATERIRQLEAPSGRRTPIIALTAGVMPGDAEKCHAAGMDDYLAKPASMQDLTAVLLQWLAAKPSASDAQSTSGSQPSRRESAG